MTNPRLAIFRMSSSGGGLFGRLVILIESEALLSLSRFRQVRDLSGSWQPAHPKSDISSLAPVNRLRYAASSTS